MLEALGLDAVAEGTYRLLLARRDLDIDRIASELRVSSAEVHAALDRLAELELVRPSVQISGGLRTISPEVGLKLLLERRQAELVRRQLQVAACQEAVEQLVSEYTETTVSVEIEEVIGMDAVAERIERLASQVETRVEAFMPGGAQDPAMIESAKVLDRQVLGRGVLIRTVGLDSIRNDPATLRYAHWLVGNGGEVRTVPTLPIRMIIYDRQAALLPVDPDNTRMGTVHLTGSGSLAALAALFDQTWDSAVPISASATSDSSGLSPQERRLLRLLSEGLTDENVAQQFGVSPRTVRRMMADLMNRLGARSRFEAGLRAAEQGWL